VELSLRELLSVISDGGVLGLLIMILFGLVKRWWVVGWVYEDCAKERDEWKDLALSGTRAAEQAVTLAQKRTPTRRASAGRDDDA
jgi:hypothetical protein